MLKEFINQNIFDKNIFRQTLKDNKTIIIIFALALALYSFMLVSLFPTVNKFSGLTEYWDSLPEGMKAFFNIQGIGFDTLEGFLTIEFVLVWILISAGFVISFANKIVVKEIESGTMELLLSYPISRKKLIITRSIVALIGILLLVLATILSILITAHSKGISVHDFRIFKFGFIGFFLCLAIYAYSLLFSCIFDERNKVILASVGLTIALYILDVFAKLSDKVKDFHFLSLFKYYDPQGVLSRGDIYWGGVGILLLFSIICFIISLIVFERKDIKT